MDTIEIIGWAGRVDNVPGSKFTDVGNPVIAMWAAMDKDAVRKLFNALMAAAENRQSWVRVAQCLVTLSQAGKQHAHARAAFHQLAEVTGKSSSRLYSVNSDVVDMVAFLRDDVKDVSLVAAAEAARALLLYIENARHSLPALVKDVLSAVELRETIRAHYAWLTDGENPAFADLSGANLAGTDLSGKCLHRANLSGANLSGANLRNADFGGADLRGANLQLADLSGADFKFADLRGADLRGAKLVGLDLRGADFKGCKNAPSVYRTPWPVPAEKEVRALLTITHDSFGDAPMFSLAHCGFFGTFAELNALICAASTRRLS